MTGSILINGPRCGKFPISLHDKHVLIPSHLQRENVLSDLRHAHHRIASNPSPIPAELQLIATMISIVEQDENPYQIAVPIEKSDEVKEIDLITDELQQVAKEPPSIERQGKIAELLGRIGLIQKG